MNNREYIFNLLNRISLKYFYNDGGGFENDLIELKEKICDKTIDVHEDIIYNCTLWHDINLSNVIKILNDIGYNFTNYDIVYICTYINIPTSVCKKASGTFRREPDIDCDACNLYIDRMLQNLFKIKKKLILMMCYKKFLHVIVQNM